MGAVAFSPKALRLIDAAVAELVEPPRKERWMTWRKKHPEAVRRSDQRWDDWGRSTLPHDIFEIDLAALDRWVSRLSEQRGKSGLSEDEISDLDNQLSHVRSVEQLLSQVPLKPK